MLDKKLRQGWNEAFAKMSAEKEDKLLLPENTDSETLEWVWYIEQFSNKIKIVKSVINEMLVE